MRSAIREEGERIRATTSADQGAFDRKAQITKTPDGTLASERSLLLQSGKQVKEDAAPFIDDAKQAVRDALKK
jgi:conjugal transfer mating pair stabilization protein TraG